MQNFIIIIFLLIVVGVGVKESMKHFRGEGGCCGGASSKPPKKKLKNKIVNVYVFHVDGMHCQNCVNAVTRAINDIDGASAKVSLRRKTAKVVCDRDVNVEEIMEAVRKRGYEIQ